MRKVDPWALQTTPKQVPSEKQEGCAGQPPNKPQCPSVMKFMRGSTPEKPVTAMKHPPPHPMFRRNFVSSRFVITVDNFTAQAPENVKTTRPCSVSKEAHKKKKHTQKGVFEVDHLFWWAFSKTQRTPPPFEGSPMSQPKADRSFPDSRLVG